MKKDEKPVMKMIKLQPKVSENKVLEDNKKKKKKKVAKDIVIYTKEVLKKILKGMRPDEHSEFFQDDRLYNLVIYDNDGNSIKMFPGAMSRKKLKNIKNKYEDASVMISISSGYFKLLPIDALIKLTKIKKMVIGNVIIAHPDGDDDFVLYDKHYEITNIGQLLKLLLTMATTDDTIMDLTAGEYWYWSFDAYNDVMIEYTDESKEYYNDKKGDKRFVDFLSDFTLTTFLR